MIEPEDLGQPLLMRPRLDAKPWGGRGLARFGFALPPDEPIGEALLTAAEAIVAAGPLADRTLGELAEARPEAFAGRNGLAATGGLPIFPMLVKLIEATAHLSIQVHPDDEAARAAGAGPLGKTEAWHVLAAAPWAELLLGLESGVAPPRLAAAARGGQSLAPLLRRLPARPGTTFLIPAGTVHALGAGILVYEIQQPSAITYRLDDWGRRDAAGQARPLHVEEGLAVVRADARPDPIPPSERRTPVGRRQLLVTCRYFALERIALPAGGSVELAAEESAQVVTCLAGTGEVRTKAGAAPLTTGTTAVIPAIASPARASASRPAVLLRGWVP